MKPQKAVSLIFTDIGYYWGPEHFAALLPPGSTQKAFLGYILQFTARIAFVVEQFAR